MDLDYQDLLFLHVTHAHMHASTRTHTHKSAHKFAHIHDYIHIQTNKGTLVRDRKVYLVRACSVREIVCVYVCVCEREGVRVVVCV